jgi:hypothetical protein
LYNTFTACPILLVAGGKLVLKVQFNDGGPAANTLAAVIQRAKQILGGEQYAVLADDQEIAEQAAAAAEAAKWLDRQPAAANEGASSNSSREVPAAAAAAAVQPPWHSSKQSDKAPSFILGSSSRNTLGKARNNSKSRSGRVRKHVEATAAVDEEALPLPVLAAPTAPETMTLAAAVAGQDLTTAAEAAEPTDEAAAAATPPGAAAAAEAVTAVGQPWAAADVVIETLPAIELLYESERRREFKFNPGNIQLQACLTVARLSHHPNCIVHFAHVEIAAAA